jgi:hypothetical protein
MGCICLVDICLDLGIVPGQMDRATWDELRLALAVYGGSLPALLIKRADKLRSADDPAGGHPRLRVSLGNIEGLDLTPIDAWPKIEFPIWPARSPQSPAPACTGPPWRGLPLVAAGGRGQGPPKQGPMERTEARMGPGASPAVPIRRMTGECHLATK